MNEEKNFLNEMILKPKQKVSYKEWTLNFKNLSEGLASNGANYGASKEAFSKTK